MPSGGAPTEAEIARRIAETLNCDCLISDDSLNPYTWVRIDAAGHRSVVDVEPDAFDRNELHIIRP